MKKEIEARFMLLGIIALIIATLGLTYVGNPPVQRFVNEKWQAVSVKVRTTWADFEKISLPPAEEMEALKEVHRKKACDANDTRVCQHLKAEEAKSNELKGLLLLDRTKACKSKRGDEVACQEIGEPMPTPKASKCPPEVTACASYEKYEAKWKKKSS